MKIFEFTLFWVTISPSYYGLMYALSFLVGYWLLRKEKTFSEKQVDSLILYLFLGVILGGRLGYVFFYDLAYFLQNPIEIFMPWLGGMSFHGGLLWVTFTLTLFAKKQRIPLLRLTDIVAWVVPIGLFFGRIGNYLNRELLWLAGYSWFWAVVVGDESYFPTPLLEAFLEWIALFVILLLIKSRNSSPGVVSASFLLLYSFFRFFVEFFRDPDLQIGYIVWDWMTMWHILSLIMFAAGMSLLVYTKKARTAASQ